MEYSIRNKEITWMQNQENLDVNTNRKNREVATTFSKK